MGHPLNRERRPGPARMLLGDAYIAICLLKDSLRRIAGVPLDGSFLTTIFAIGVLVSALGRVTAPALKVFRPRHPSFADAMIAGAVLREAPRGIAGVGARDKRFAGTIIAISLVAPMMRGIAVPVLGARRAVRAAFARRYGATW